MNGLHKGAGKPTGGLGKGRGRPGPYGDPMNQTGGVNPLFMCEGGLKGE